MYVIVTGSAPVLYFNKPDVDYQSVALVKVKPNTGNLLIVSGDFVKSSQVNNRVIPIVGIYPVKNLTYCPTRFTKETCQIILLDEYLDVDKTIDTITIVLHFKNQ